MAQSEYSGSPFSVDFFYGVFKGLKEAILSLFGLSFCYPLHCTVIIKTHSSRLHLIPKIIEPIKYLNLPLGIVKGRMLLLTKLHKIALEEVHGRAGSHVLGIYQTKPGGLRIRCLGDIHKVHYKGSFASR